MYLVNFTEDNPKLSATLFGIFLATRGIGNILSSPISIALSNLDLSADASGSSSTASASVHLGFDVAEGKFAKMILYTGTCFAGVGIIALVGLGLDTMRYRERRGRAAQV